MPRDPQFVLAAALRVASFTPARKDAPALVELVVAGDPRAAAALAKLDDSARAAIAARYATGDDLARARMVAVLGKLGDEPGVIGAIKDSSPRVRRAAASALGKLATDAARAALHARWEAADVTPDERRVLVEAIAHAGGDDARARLQAVDVQDDAELARRRDRALLVIDRDARRSDESTIAVDVPPPAPIVVRLHCKPGLVSLLAEDFPSGKPSGDSALDVELRAPWASLYASRLWSSAGIRIPLDGDTPEAITSTIVSPRVRALLAAWTRGPIRWRLGFAHGHRRAVVWRVARDVTARAPELLNDPRQTSWDILVDDGSGERALEIVPRRAQDPRFAWRVAEVPAASHPTVAAALARVAGVADGDRVWDPFVGAGAELVERALLGPTKTLFGSDLDEGALSAARENLTAAGLTATLEHADARVYAPGPVDLIITNPPLGSRLRGDAGGLLAACLPHFARQLASGGRLVWITPAVRKTQPIAEHSGLRLTRALEVDLGGVRGRLERWVK